MVKYLKASSSWRERNASLSSVFYFLRVHIAAADTGDGAARRCKQFLDFICFFLIHEPVSPNLKSNLKFHLIVDQISREVKSPASGVNARQTKKGRHRSHRQCGTAHFPLYSVYLIRLSTQQYLYCLPEGGVLPHISRKYHIGNMGKTALLPGLPHRHAGTYLSHYRGPLHPERLCAHIR